MIAIFMWSAIDETSIFNLNNGFTTVKLNEMEDESCPSETEIDIA
jgi:hypothetical protein